MTRREMLAMLGASAAGAAVGAVFPGALLAESPSARWSIGRLARTGRAADPAVVPFDMRDVELLDGPFRRARERDAAYLLSLDPDRLLHNFRVNAGLAPKAPVYGGWESEEPWVDIRCQGHTLGHYLSATSLMYESTGDAAFRERIDYIVGELKACQDAGGDGLVCGFPDGSTQLDNSVSGRPFVGVPWYTMHKIFAGLRDAHVHGGSGGALPVLVALTDWAWNETKGLSDGGMQHMLDREHGGMNEVLADVFALTGRPRHLTLAERFNHHALLDPLAAGRDTLNGLHANTQIPKVIGFARLHELTGKPEYARAARFFWRTVTENRCWVTGGMGDGEHFFPPADFPAHLHSAKTMETCCTHNQLRLTRMLFGHNPSADLADYYERALYNGILASQDPDSGMMTYFQPTRPGYLKLYNTPIRSFWCCTGTGIENHAKYSDSIYFHDDDGLYVNLFIPSRLTWAAKRMSVVQETRFPESETVRLSVDVAAPTAAALRIRHPSWCAAMSVAVNGSRWPASSGPGDYLAIDRQWRAGDVVDVQLPMTLATRPLEGAPDRVAVTYGPLVLAGVLGREGIAPGADLIRNERTTGDVLNAPVDVPVWAAERSEVVSHIERSDESALAFRTVGLGRPNDVDLVPYHQVAHERYNLYWQLV